MCDKALVLRRIWWPPPGNHLIFIGIYRRCRFFLEVEFANRVEFDHKKEEEAEEPLMFAIPQT